MPLTPDQFEALRSGVLSDLTRFAPECVVAGAVVLLLGLRLFKAFDRLHLSTVATAATLAALAFVVAEWGGYLAGRPGGPAFSGLLRLDPFAAFLRGFLLAFAALALMLGRFTGIPDRTDAGDYGVLLLGGTLGMMVMASASHLMTVFLGLEMASLPCYALAGFLKGRRPGSEAALKYVLYGSAASGVALYGISLLVAAFGGGSFEAVADGVAKAAAAGRIELPVAAGLMLLLVGFAFKLSAVPMHFWAPDVFEGAAAEVGAFLSVASKGAAVALTARFLLTLANATAAIDPLLWPKSIGVGAMVAAGLTATVGNLAALAQTNLKRMLAYSTIAHAGYMLMALAPLTADGTSAVLYYLAGYLPANLGAFAIVAAVRNATGGETLAHVRGLVKWSPGLAAALAVFLLSLLGLPPLAGFAGKFQAFQALYAGGHEFSTVGGGRGLAVGCYALLAVGVLNTVVSAAYYLRVLKAAVLDADDAPDAPRPNVNVGVGVIVAVLAAATVLLGVAWNPMNALTERAVAGLR